MPQEHPKIVKAYQDFIDEYEREEPDWKPITILRLIKAALGSLWQYIQDPDIRDISWDRPWAELQYPVAWDWKREAEDGGQPLLAEIIISELNESGTDARNQDSETIASKLSDLFEKHRELSALAHVTRNAVFLKQGDLYRPRLTKEQAAEMEGLSKHEQLARLEEMFEPFYYGEIDEECPLMETSDDGSPEKPRPSLRFIMTDAQQRLLTDGHIFTEIRPLMVDVDERRAYYAAIVGLSFIAPAKSLFPEPTAWPPEFQEAFWVALNKLIDAEIDKRSRYGKLTADEVAPCQGPVPPADEPAASAVLPAVVPPTPAKMPFPLAFGPAVADKIALKLVLQVHKVRLPAKKWSTLPSWGKQKEAEIKRILAQHGEEAFKSFRGTSKDRNVSGPLLKRWFHKGKGETIQLTAEAENALKIRVGLQRGYRYFDRDDLCEYFVRVFEVGSGYLEVGLSWYGMAGPWVEEWRRDFQKQIALIAEQARQDVLPFDDLDAERKEEIDRLVRRAQLLEDGRKVMEMALGQVSRQAQNIIRIPAIALKVLLGLENNKDWRARVEGGLHALRACTFRVNSFKTKKIKGYGTLLGEWWYEGAGPGDHGEGDYYLDVRPGFLGCLSVFETAGRRLNPKHEIIYYDFGKKLTAADKESQSWGRKATKTREKPSSSFSRFDAGGVFYNAAEGLSPERENLIAFLEAEITLRRDSVSRILGDYQTRKSIQAKPTSQDAKRPRIYGNADCPLLPEGKRYVAALGHFRRSPESGRTLYGSEIRSSATGGAHVEGLISFLGYVLPPGGAHKERRRVVRQTLEDIKAVVVEYLGGVAAARGRDKSWVTLEEAAKLGEQELGKQLKWFFFLPETWQEDRKNRWEELQAQRAARGETPHAWTPTEDQAQALRARAVLAGEATIQEPNVPLRHRLQAVRTERKLSLQEVGRIFGVSKMTVSNWETGREPDETGKVRGKRIPRELVPLVERWIETGQEPMPEELAARKTRRSGVKSDPLNN